MRFAEIHNHEALKQQLAAVIDADKISHAQLFYGKEGGAAVPMALAYVQYLYCENKSNGDACGVCSSCVKNQNMAHPDVHFSFPYLLVDSGSKPALSTDYMAIWKEFIQEKKGIITQELWREKAGFDNKKAAIGTAESENIAKKLSLKSFEGGYKTLIMWLPELMNESASNKLLKLIEEPPAKTLFVLITEHPDGIIQTIRSRTQMLTIPNYQSQEVAKLLLKNTNVTEEEAQSIANVSEGNLAYAFKLASGDEENIHFELFKQWMRLCYQKDISAIIDWVDELATLGREQHKAFIKYALHFVRNAMMTNYMGDKLVHLNGEELSFNQKFAPFIHHNNAIAFYEELSQVYYNLERNASPKPLLLDLSIKVNYLIHKEKGE